MSRFIIGFIVTAVVLFVCLAVVSYVFNLTYELEDVSDFQWKLHIYHGEPLIVLDESDTVVGWLGYDDGFTPVVDPGEYRVKRGKPDAQDRLHLADPNRCPRCRKTMEPNDRKQFKGLMFFHPECHPEVRMELYREKYRQGRQNQP